MILARLVLGLLNLAPMTGYDLKKVFDSSISHFWAADKAQIYRTLTALVADGYATVEVLTEGGSVWGYASVIDNATGDPTTVPMAIQ
jgi:DNA-binding PadR family transcriptional regulator